VVAARRGSRVLGVGDGVGLGLGWLALGEVVGARVTVEGAVGEHVPGGGEHAHVGAGLGDEHLSDPLAETRDALQQFPGREKRFHQRLDPG